MSGASRRQGARRDERGWTGGATPFLLIVVAGALAHLWCLGSEFFLDDVLQIRDSDHILEGTWWEPTFRKWTYFSYWLQYQTWGMSSLGFHAVNWLLHIAVAVMLYVFGRDALPMKEAKGVALCGALLFVVHPLGSEIPNYARTQDLAWVTLFSLGAAWMVIRCTRDFRWAWVVGVVLCVLGATYSKEPGLAHVGMMVGFVVLGCRAEELGRFLKSYWRWIVAVGLVGGSLLWFGGPLQLLVQRSMNGWAVEGFGWHAVTLCRVFWKFVGLFLFPRDLSADHFVAGTYSWEDSQAVPAIVGVVLWVLVATGLMIKSRTRFVGMCLWLFVGSILFRMLYFINEFMPEYRIYPGLPWLCLGVMVVGWVVWRKALRISPVAVMGLLVLILCLVSATRSFRWHSLDTLAEDTLRLYPGHLRALWVLQRRDVEFARWDDVIERHARVRAVSEAFVGENKRLKGRRMSTGHHLLADVALAGYYAEALAAKGEKKAALEIMTRVEAYLKEVGRFDEQSKVFVHVYYHALGRVREQLGDYEAALAALEKTDRLNHRRVDIKRVTNKLDEAGEGSSGE